VSGGGRGGGGGGTMVEPGNYTVRLTVGGQTLSTSVVVLEDIWMKKE
jgi:PKD repeat protein